ncbi:hypothetical protein L1049_003686 [Liquidambar formosana]|uniref:Uncharacterized protein n=1 Tax=Liquidambar formosana TaxID=63359 RepID=A0AAP0RM67_LIQFO
MDPVPVSSEESGADTPHLMTIPRDITESNSIKYTRIGSRDANGNGKDEEGKEICDKMVITSYLPLYKAAIEGDRTSARRILKEDGKAASAKITWNSETVLHVAVTTGLAIEFVEELIGLMPPESLALRDKIGNTALGRAARVGNTKAAELLVKENPNLLKEQNDFGNTPLHLAAKYGHMETLRYLLNVTRREEPSLFVGKSGVRLLNFLIVADFYGLALDLLKEYPKLAVGEDKKEATAFMTLAEKPQAFASRSQFGYWQRKIYHCIPVEIDNVPHNSMGNGDEESQTDSSQRFSVKSTYHRFLQQISTSLGR